MLRVLIIHAPGDNLAQLNAVAQEENWKVQCADMGEPLLVQDILGREPHVVFLFLSQSEHVKWLSDFRLRHPTQIVVAVATRTRAELAILAMRQGCSHCWMQETGVNGLKEIAHDLTLTALPSGEPSSYENPFAFFVGRDPKIQEVFSLIDAVKSSDATVLITGESGTGKELVARAIHETSFRRNAPWMAINCGAIPHTLLESELFGHAKGAFTGATSHRPGRFTLAGQGTLFLDEVGDLPLDLQVKLLRALQTKSFEAIGSPVTQKLEARVIAATNLDLERSVAEKKFREDLYYRLNVIPIQVPSLRQRKSDIPLLATYFISHFALENKKNIIGLSPDALGCLMDYHWPGNVRELENLMERVIILKKSSGPVELRDFPEQTFKKIQLQRFVPSVSIPDEGVDFNHAVDSFENELIVRALQKTSGNKNRAAHLLNLNRTTLVEKLKRKGLTFA